MPRDRKIKAEEVMPTAKSSNSPPPYKKEMRGRETAISPADMGSTK